LSPPFGLFSHVPFHAQLAHFLDEGKPVGAAARDLDLTESSLRNWVDWARLSGIPLRQRRELARCEISGAC